MYYVDWMAYLIQVAAVGPASLSKLQRIKPGRPKEGGGGGYRGRDKGYERQGYHMSVD